MTVDMSQFYEVFFDEAMELLAEKERLLLNIDVTAPDAEDLNAVFRTAHSIKGGAATFGFSDITEMTHVLESLLDRIRKSEITLTIEHVDAFLAAKDVLTMLIDGHRHGSAVEHQQVASVSHRLNRLSELGDAASIPATITAPPVEDSIELALAEGMHKFHITLPVTPQRDVDALITELGLMGEVKHMVLPNGGIQFTLITENSADDIFAVCSFVVDIDALKIEEIATVIPEPEIIAPAVMDESAATVTEVAQPQRRESDKADPNKGESNSIRVSIEKVDQLINLVGELVITQAMIDQRIAVLDPMVYENLLNSVNQLARNTRDLQESVMSIRMMPMDYVFSRFPRMVRDLASKLGKKIDFITQGAATELDKGLIERIVDPLNHLVRNSVDHGIETPSVRREAGKPETGKLTLAASHQGGNIVIEVRDDGAGLNRERILQKAQQQGIAVSDSMPDDEVWQLIFAPGFSTAEAVTDVSGRGVGMDVVKRNITAMGGTVDIRSTRGHGSTMRISLPLTLAILDGMSVKVGAEVYIVPLTYVIESLQPEAINLKEVAGQGRLIKVREEYLPLIYLHEQFSIENHCENPEQGIVVILSVDGKKAALLVDSLVGQQQVVVKNLESNFRKVSGISGATILGDGGVSLILDVAALMRTLG